MGDKNHHVPVTGMCNLLWEVCRYLRDKNKVGRGIPTFIHVQAISSSRFLRHLNFDRVFSCAEHQAIFSLIYICDDVRITWEFPT